MRADLIISTAALLTLNGVFGNAIQPEAKCEALCAQLQDFKEVGKLDLHDVESKSTENSLQLEKRAKDPEEQRRKDEEKARKKAEDEAKKAEEKRKKDEEQKRKDEEKARKKAEDEAKKAEDKRKKDAKDQQKDEEKKRKEAEKKGVPYTTPLPTPAAPAPVVAPAPGTVPVPVPAQPVPAQPAARPMEGEVPAQKSFASLNNVKPAAAMLPAIFLGLLFFY